MANNLKADCTAQFYGWFCAAFTQWVNKIYFEVTFSIQAYVKCNPMTTHNSELQHNITVHCKYAFAASQGVYHKQKLQLIYKNIEKPKPTLLLGQWLWRVRTS